MKKFALILITLLCLLSACGGSQTNTKNGAKEYTSDEFASIYWDISEFKEDKFNSMTNEERYGKTDSEEERQKNAKELSTKFQKEAMKKHKIKFGDRIRVRGKISSAVEGDKVLILRLDSTDEDNKDYLEFPIIMSDKDMEIPMEGTLVVIEGEFSEERAGGAGMFEKGEIISQ